MPKIYYAKSPNIDGSQETVKAHCQKVSAQAAGYGLPLSLEEEARLCGLYHDFGKYSERFQGVLSRTYTGIDHAFSSAVLCDWLTRSKKRKLPSFVIEAINGHHDGLQAYHSIKDQIEQNLESTYPVYCNNRKESALCGIREYNEAITAICFDFLDREELKYRPTIQQEPAPDNLSAMLDTRMLFSCLVDADYTISAGKNEHYDDLQPQALLDTLYAYHENLRKGSQAHTELNALRDRVFVRCGQVGAEAEPGVFTLTAPTGTGKTMALLHFALRHCLSHPTLKRIILVLPFLTLTEQSANAYASIVPDILQDHSQSEMDAEAGEHAAKWDSPFIITTSVKFFQTLFANQPTDCRKLHNIANSVILFDEAQTLPANITISTLRSINRLCFRFGCTMVLSTATQPDYSPLTLTDWSPIEILPDYAELYAQTIRTKAVWNLDSPISLEEIAVQMTRENNVCTIVNLRAHARKLYTFMKDQCGEEGTFFLTTDLCPCHRTQVVKEIKKRQKAGLPCWVVSTQCIEAGVDLDFSALFRALAPWEAIIQAAGRCNRNGRMDKPGIVTIFIPDEERLYPDVWYQTAAEMVKTLLERQHGNLELHDPDNISAYYRLLFDNQHEKPALVSAIEKTYYETTAQEYRLIDNSGYKVLVPYAEKMELYHQLRQEAIETGITASWLKRAAPITVTTFEKLAAGGYPVEQTYYPRKRESQCTPSDVFLLNTGAEDYYKTDMGLQLAKMETENFIFDYYMP